MLMFDEVRRETIIVPEKVSYIDSSRSSECRSHINRILGVRFQMRLSCHAAQQMPCKKQYCDSDP
jgi:hypothetical protein